MRNGILIQYAFLSARNLITLEVPLNPQVPSRTPQPQPPSTPQPLGNKPLSILDIPFNPMSDPLPLAPKSFSHSFPPDRGFLN